MTRSRSLTVLLAGVLLVGAANLGAFAATGAPLLLGKSNSASKTTTLKTTGNGAALRLKTKKDAPPLKVNGSGKVANLNADRLDGQDSEALETTSYSYSLTRAAGPGTSTKFTFPGVPDGRYLVSYNISADIAGGSAFFCYFYPDGAGGDGISRIASIADPLGSNWHATASGELDMAIPDTYALYCESNGGAGITIPGGVELAAQVVFTRIDNLTTGTRPGGPLS